jgi:hypothetical protein
VYAAVLIAAIILAAAVTLLLKQQAEPAHNLPRTAAPVEVTTPVQIAPPTAASVLSAPVASVDRYRSRCVEATNTRSA